jgi:hypothetical protein
VEWQDATERREDALPGVPRRGLASIDRGAEPAAARAPPSPALTLVSLLVGFRGMTTARKITVEVPGDLLERAIRASGEGVTATVRRGLELVAAGRAYEDLKALRGKVRLGLDLDRLREDR